MKFSILPVFIALIFGFCFFITFRAQKNQSLNTKEARSVYALLGAFGVWTLVSVLMGMNGQHLALRETMQLLWQANVAVIIVVIGLFSKPLRDALSNLAHATPLHWLAFVQILRIGALGAVIKYLRGDITSMFPLWVGVPDFLFGLSAILVGWLVLKERAGRLFLILWNLTGAGIILLPLFLLTNYWMNEPGFSFIFEFPMILAPSIVVPILILLNFLMAWKVWKVNV